MTAPSQTDILGGLLWPGFSWSTPTITFSIPTAGSRWADPYGSAAPTSPGYGVLDAAQAQSVRLAMATIAKVIAVPLIETDDLANPGQIRFAFTDTGPNASAYAAYPPAMGQAVAPIDGDVWLGAFFRQKSLAPDVADYVGFLDLLHEAGHALGLKHPHQGDITLPFEWTNNRYTVMGYDALHDPVAFTFRADPTEAEGFTRDITLVGPKTPMVFDVLALQSLYAANPSTNAGDTVYTWDPAKAAVETVYDAGGTDTIDLASHVRPSIIDLTPGAYSSIDYFPLEAQRAYWLATTPGAARLINTSYDDPLLQASGYTWKDNLGIAYGTIIENVRAGSGADTITGNSADNTLSGGGGSDMIAGGAGADTIDGGPGQNYLRGDEGADSLTGGSGFDDINGNAGNDTARGGGGGGDDWVVGGKDADLLNGEAGADIVYGNMGDDWCDGGEGADTVRGGQGDDVVLGQVGDDWLSGDRGDDTITGGLGADTFYSFGDAGLDRITDFSVANGDRILLDRGVSYELSQVGPDAVVSLAGGGHIVLAGVASASLSSAWLVWA
jgi:serralysin